MAERPNCATGAPEDGQKSLPRESLEPRIVEQILTEGINALPSGFALFDAEDRAVVTNRVFREMLPEGAKLLDAGAKFSEMARENAITQFGLEGEALDDWMAERLAYRDTPTDHFDQQLMDGRWFRIQESRTSDGGTVTNWTDITDLKQQEKVSEEYADALMTTNERLDEFARAASHDLQEPLRKIEMFSGRLSDKCGEQLNDAGKAYLDRILNATGRMKRLINSLLDFSRAASEEKNFSDIDLNVAITDALGNLEFQIQDKEAVVCVDDFPGISGNLDQIVRLFQNLISNAIKYVEPGTQPKVVIDIHAQDAESIQIAVRDNGIGFDQKHSEKIFEVFQRLHGRGGAYEGTGVGLASCRKIAEQHNGSIRAEGIIGEGSTFFVTLPMNPVSTAGSS